MQKHYWFEAVLTQCPQNVIVWAVLVGDIIVGPYFWDETLTAHKYLDFLRFELIPTLVVLFPNEEDVDIPNKELWFQQDSAPFHYAAPVREFLCDVFPNR